MLAIEVIISSITPGGPAEDAGLRRGDLIKEINRQPITSVEEYNNALAEIDKEESFLALIRRGENTLYVVVNAK